MSFNLDGNLFIDVDAPGGQPCLLDGKSSSNLGGKPTYLHADCFPLNLYFRTRNGQGTPSTAVELATMNIVLGAKLLGDLTAETLLFFASEFTAVGEGDDLHYQAQLDLNTTELATALEGAKSVTARVNIELENPGNTQRLSYQFDVTIQEQAYGGESDPTPATPIYPAPSLLYTKLEADARFETLRAVASVSATGALTPDAGADKVLNVTMTGDVTLHAPTNPTDGLKLELRLLASGADRALALNAGDFALPASSALTWPVTVASGTRSILLLDYCGATSKWLVVAYVPGY